MKASGQEFLKKSQKENEKFVKHKCDFHFYIS